MAQRFQQSFGFPRWGEYGRETEAKAVRMCDYVHCNERGDHPAPKSPGSPERWYFCKRHAAEYNQNWNFFEGMTDAEASAFAAGAESSNPFSQSHAFEWGGAVDENGFSSTEQRAFDILEVDTDASVDEVKTQYRKLAKLYHPDANSGDPEAAQRFHELQTAYDIVSKAVNRQG